MPTTITLLDAFADRAFSGNQAAVAVLSAEPDAGWMQHMAAELQLPETAFCWPTESHHRLRWFSPVAEVDLCGHATLATAAALWADGHAHRDEPARFDTRSGVLTCTRLPSGEIELDLPGLRIESTDLGLPWPELGLPEPDTTLATVDDGMAFAIAVFDEARVVENADVDLSMLARSEKRPLVITAPGERGADVVSRVFAPNLGIPEDPVTGSAHAAIGPWWADRLGVDTLACRQASTRGGTLRATVADDRVLLAGRCVVVGHLMVTPAAGPT